MGVPPRRPVRYRTIILTCAVAATLVTLVSRGVFLGLLVLAIGVAAAVLVGRRERLRRPPLKGRWKPTVQHPELPPPADDPFIGWNPAQVEGVLTQTIPLAEFPLAAALRGQLDALALGRAKRIVEAPTLLQHAANDAESWPHVESAVADALALAERQFVELAPQGRPQLSQALALCAAQGVLLAEWRQLEDGPTAWQDSTARIRASDAFTIYRLAEAMRRRLLPDLFAGVHRRSNFDIGLLVPYTIAQAFFLRLRGAPPRVRFAA